MSTKKDNFFVPGSILIIVGFLISLNPYWITFGTPIIYITGAILVYLSHSKPLTKTLLILIPLFLWFPGVWAVSYFSVKPATPETFLIPQKFRGEIVLIYGESCGQELKMENGRYIYRIPANGVMIIKDVLKTGAINREYFFADSTYKKTEKIPVLNQKDFNEPGQNDNTVHEPPRNEIAVFLGKTSTGTYTNKKPFAYHEIYVNTYDGLKAFHSSQVDDRAFGLLKACKIKK